MVEKGCQPNEDIYIVLIEGLGYAGMRAEARELTDYLFQMDVLSSDTHSRLNKTFRVVRQGSNHALTKK